MITNNSIPIYTIGYGNRKISHFIELLSKSQINNLIDVRLFPYSEFNLYFNRENLQINLLD